jgi:XTP/dITP diphosphohydrolase
VQTFLLASRNRHKLRELEQIVAPELPDIALVGDDGPEPVENGMSFEENALIKARDATQRTGLPAIADDSGIAVDALNGCPGIFSARWGGPERDDRGNFELLLWQMNDVPDSYRQAAFHCAAALVFPNGQELVTHGVWKGTLMREPAGVEGFGYDPIFQPEGESRSAAELGPEEKNAVSHRTLAFSELVSQLKQHRA